MIPNPYDIFKPGDYFPESEPNKENHGPHSENVEKYQREIAEMFIDTRIKIGLLEYQLRLAIHDWGCKSERTCKLAQLLSKAIVSIHEILISM